MTKTKTKKKTITMTMTKTETKTKTKTFQEHLQIAIRDSRHLRPLRHLISEMRRKPDQRPKTPDSIHNSWDVFIMF